MAKTIELTVPEPCHENWNDMTPTEKGRFCASCQKDVVDFTNMGQAELIAFFRKKTSGNVCGRFYNDQLNNPMPVPVKRIPWARYFFQITLPAFIASGKLMAQGKVVSEFKKNETEITVLAGFAQVKEKSTGPKQSATIKVQVTDETGNGIPYASIINTKTKAGIATDSLGNFIIAKTSLSPTTEFTVSAVGYHTRSFFIFPVQDTPLQLQLTSNNLLDEVVITAQESPIRKGGVMLGGLSIVRTVSNNTTNLLPPKAVAASSITLSPNPVRLNRDITIRLNNETTGRYQYTVLAMDGRVVLSGTKDYTVGKNNLTLPIDNRFVAGTYMVQLIGENSLQKESIKFIVQH